MTTTAPEATRLALLRDLDPELYEVVAAEEQHQAETLDLIASENIAPPVLLELQATLLTNRVAVEGALGGRFHAGTANADRIEQLAVERAKSVFGAEYANVQPHSGVNANLAVFAAALEPGDRLLAMSTKAGGHVSHGTKFSLAGRIFETAFYGVDDETEQLDYEAIAQLARSFRPKLIVAGASSYPRAIDFARLGEIAGEVGACMHVDMAHIAGLVAGGVHASPVPHSHYVAATTYKTLRGAKGAFVLAREQYAKALDMAIFPGTQGSENVTSIACKAYTFLLCGSAAFARYAEQVVTNARVLASTLADAGLRPVTGGTDTHLIILDLRSRELTGLEAQQRLELVGIDSNRNQIPNDPLGHETTSGLRLGTSSITARGLHEVEVREVADVIDRALAARELPRAEAQSLRARVASLCEAFPLENVGW